MIIEKFKTHRFIINFKKYRYLLTLLVKREIQVKYRRSVLGIFWSFLEPLLMMVLITIVFSTVFQRNVPNFPVYYLSGYLIYQFFATGTNASMTSIISNAGILKTIYVPKYIYCLSSVLSSFITFLISLIVLFMVMIATNVNFTIYIIFASIPILILIFLIIGVGLILAALNVFFRDIVHLWRVFIIMLMWATPIFYPPDIVPESFRWIQYYNPLYAIIICFRSSILYSTLFNLQTLLFATISGLVALIIGILIFYKFKEKFILHI